MPPRLVTVEPSAGCNCRCAMCPTHLYAKRGGFLDFDLFRLIADEAAGFCEVLVFQGAGEPFLHPRLREMITYARKIGISNIHVSTNGTLVREKEREWLLDPTSAPSSIQFSIDGATELEFESIRSGASFNVVHSNLAALKNTRDSQRLVMPEITIATLLRRGFDCSAFLEKWGAMVDDITITPMLRQADRNREDCQEFLDGVMSVRHDYLGCPKPYEVISITSEGDVTACQHDFGRSHIMGKLGQGAGLLDIWRNAEYREFRKSHITFAAETTACKGCKHMYRIIEERELFSLRKTLLAYFQARTDNRKGE